MPVSAMRMRLSPSKAKGLVTTPTVRMPSSRTARAMTGAAPVPVPPPMPAVMKTMCEPASCSRISSSDSSAPARPTSGCAPAPRPSVSCAPIWMRRWALDCASACASVLATTKSTPSSLEAIMLLTALPPAPPTPRTVMRGRSSVVSGALSLIVIAQSPCRLPVSNKPRTSPNSVVILVIDLRITQTIHQQTDERNCFDVSPAEDLPNRDSDASGGMVAPAIRRPTAVA